MGAALDIEGRTALVTGAASGIGLATARRLAAAGARVVVSDRAGAALDAVAAELPGARAVAAELTDRDELARLVAEAGEVQILVNNAGLQHVSPVEDFPEEAWDTILAVMLTAPFLLAKAFLPEMLEGGYGRVLNIASVHGLVASPYKVAYVSAKHGLLGLTKTIALEAAGRCPDVTAHAICPSYVRTPLIEAQIADQARAHGIDEERVLTEIILAENAVKRLLEPDEVAAAVEYLCGAGAWALTGSAFPMDAGRLAH
jgi:3-hydroxybutyrate dehydrogenase